MATIAVIASDILTRLEQEGGSDEWWTSSEIESYINDIYIDTCKSLKLLRKRDITTHVSVVGQSAYTLPSNTIELIGMTYDGKPIYPTTIEELNAYSRTWRAEGNATPTWYYFEHGMKYTQISLHNPPGTAGEEIGFDVIYKPTALASSASPVEPFTDGYILRDGVVSLALAKEGGGQNLDRSEYYFNMFISKLDALTKETKIVSRIHVLRSIEDSGLVTGIGRGPRLPDTYPPYSF